MTAAISDTGVVVEIDVEAGAAEVFEALTDPVSVLEWWTDEGDGYSCTAFEADVRPGGRWWSEHRPRSGEGSVCILAGEYTEVDAPRRLVFTWVYERFTEAYESLPATTVAIELTETAGVTHVRLMHSGLPAGSTHGSDHASGWRNALEGVARLMRRRHA